jgi:3-hydroxyisobutyrate dehydrogenase
MTTVGFVGLGRMGVPMASNLLAGGHSLIVHDSDGARATSFTGDHRGVLAATAPADFAAAEIVVTMLPDGRSVASALLEWGVASGLARGAIVIDMSSSNPVHTLALGERLSELAIALVDAPVSGGVRRAVPGTLTIMIGGDDEAVIARAEPILEALGERLIRTGPLGSGHAMKALNNYCGGAAYASLAEAVAIGRRYGLSTDVMLDVINTSTGRSFTSQSVFAEEVATGRYASGFLLSLLAKDVGIAAALAADAGVQAPVCDLVTARLETARDALGENADHSQAHLAWFDERFASEQADGE